eukprot:m51a1_g9016 putative cullin c (746) ;mRNA; r:171252-174367
MSTSKKKVMIKPFRSQVQMDAQFADKTWKLLRSAIIEIHRQNASGLSFEELYRNAYNMVLHKYGEMLYRGLKELVEEHLREVAEGVLREGDDTFLTKLNKAWSDHKISMLMIRDILMYMDRVYVMHHHVPPVYDLGLMLFCEHVARSPQAKPRLLRLALDLVHRDRNGEVVDRSLLKNLTQMLMDVGVNSRTVYEEDFEKAFLESSAHFFRKESQDFIEVNSCSDYMKKVETRIKEELQRVTQYMDAATEPKIKEVLDRELIATHMKRLLEMDHGFISMLKDNKTEDLQRMYTLFGRVQSGHQSMREMMSSHLQEVGKSIVMDEEKVKSPIDYVQSLIDLKDKYDLILQNAFSSDKTFAQTINQSFESFINANPKSPENLSLFVDDKLKKGLKGVSDDETDVILNKVMMLFRFVQDKDVFERYYKQHLARRLLLGRSVSDDAEQSMIAKLKMECGFQLTSKLEGMFNDMKVSAEAMAAFRDWLSNRPPQKIELSVNVLTTGYWPTQAVTTCTLPPEILECCEVFRKFYMSNHSGRKLTWQTNMGTADVKAIFGERKHELNMSTYQMVVLLQFNDNAKLSFKEIQELTSIPIPDLKRVLSALACGKVHILQKASAAAANGGAGAPGAPVSTAVDETDVFLYNSKFKSKLVRIKVMALVQKETPSEASETRQKIDEDRNFQIDAAIVRTMKARRTMEHQQLVIEVTKQLQARFLPNPIVIKKRIETLIEREYLERNKSDRKIYEYLA